MLTPLSFRMPSPLNVRWVPLKLTKAIMGMAVECTDHETEIVRFCILPKTGVIKGCLKGTADIIGTANFGAEQPDKLVDCCNRILSTTFSTSSIINNDIVKKIYSSP